MNASCNQLLTANARESKKKTNQICSLTHMKANRKDLC